MDLDSSIQGVLGQMRNLRAETQFQLQQAARAVDRPDAAAGPERVDFGGLVKDALDSVSSLQKDASARADAFVRGESQDLVGVMLAAQKSSVAFQAATQVRNRMVSAYQDIMNMPI